MTSEAGRCFHLRKRFNVGLAKPAVATYRYVCIYTYMHMCEIYSHPKCCFFGRLQQNFANLPFCLKEASSKRGI